MTLTELEKTKLANIRLRKQIAMMQALEIQADERATVQGIARRLKLADGSFTVSESGEVSPKAG